MFKTAYYNRKNNNHAPYSKQSTSMTDFRSNYYKLTQSDFNKSYYQNNGSSHENYAVKSSQRVESNFSNLVLST